MSNSGRFDAVMGLLSDSRHTFRCDELGELLESIDCRIKNCKSQHHKLVFHDQIKEFRSISYNCGHGRNPEIKRPYINNILKHLKNLEPQFRNYLDEE